MRRLKPQEMWASNRTYCIACITDPSFSYFERSGRRERRGNVIAHTVDDLKNKTTEKGEDPERYGTLYDKTTEKGPSIPTYVFLPVAHSCPEV
jgi:hypothetical protein